MRAAARATAILTSGTAVKVMAGMAVAKAWAVLAGPAGVGVLGLMQGLVGVAGLVAALGLSTGVVRLGAAALARRAHDEMAALASATLRGSAAAGALAAAVVVVLREPLGQQWLGAPAPLADALWLGAGVWLTVMTGAQLGVLNAHQRVGALTRAAIWSSISGAIAGVALLAWLGPDGLAAAYVGGLLATWATTARLLHRSRVMPASVSWPALAKATRRLTAFGLPFTASALVGSGTMLVLPVLVLHALGIEAVGHYRAALAIAAGYLGFLLVGMGQDYYPRLAAADGAELGARVNDQLRLLLLVGAPVVLFAQATATWVVPLLYTPSFAPAVRLLEWQLAGSLFRFWGWAFAFVLLARHSAGTYFMAEAAGGAMMLGATWAGLRWGGLEGAGIGFLAAYVGYAVLVGGLVCRADGVRLDTVLVGQISAVSGVSLALLAVPQVAWGPWAALAIATVVSAGCAAELFRRLRASSSRPPPPADRAAS